MQAQQGHKKRILVSIEREERKRDKREPKPRIARKHFSLKKIRWDRRLPWEEGV